MGAGTLVVGRQRGAGPRQVAAEGGGERLDHPAGMRGDRRQMADRVVVIAGCGQQHREIAAGGLQPGGEAAQHRVGEPYRPFTAGPADQVDGRVDRGPRRHPGAQQLVGTQPQRVPHRRVHLVHRAVGDRGEQPVQDTQGAQGAVGQLGGETPVAGGQLAAGQQRRQQQVRVGATLVDGPQDLPGEQPGGIGPGRRRPGPLPCPRAPGGGRTHVNLSPAAMRAPRAHASAAIVGRPSGRTSSSSTTPPPVPTAIRP